MGNELHVNRVSSSCQNRLTADDGDFDLRDQLYLGAMLLSTVVAMVVVSFAGIIALHLKLVGLKATLDIPIGRWGLPRWLAFLGFANQIAGLVPLAKVVRTTILENANWNARSCLPTRAMKQASACAAHLPIQPYT